MISNLGHSLTHIQNGPIFRHITWNGVEFIISLNSWEYSPIPDFQNEKHRPPPNSTPSFLSSTRTVALKQTPWKASNWKNVKARSSPNLDQINPRRPYFPGTKPRPPPFASPRTAETVLDRSGTTASELSSRSTTVSWCSSRSICSKSKHRYSTCLGISVSVLGFLISLMNLVCLWNFRCGVWESVWD